MGRFSFANKKALSTLRAFAVSAFPADDYPETPIKKYKKGSDNTAMVEMRGVEPLSESHLPTLSTSVAGILNLPQHSAYRQALCFGSP